MEGDKSLTSLHIVSRLKVTRVLNGGNHQISFQRLISVQQCVAVDFKLERVILEGES